MPIRKPADAPDPFAAVVAESSRKPTFDLRRSPRPGQKDFYSDKPAPPPAGPATPDLIEWARRRRRGGA